MPRLFDEPENTGLGELFPPLFEDARSTAFSRQISPPNPLHSPADSQISSANRFASLVHSPVSPAYKSVRSSARSSLARQLNGGGDKTEGLVHSNDGGELSPASAGPRQSSRLRSASVRTEPTQLAPPLVKQELRAKGKTDAKGAIRKVGRPAKTVAAPRRGRPVKAAKKSKATAGVQKEREEWEVEEIVDSRIDQETLQHWFRVKWKGYTNKHNTWEPKKNLANCKTLVEDYEEKARK